MRHRRSQAPAYGQSQRQLQAIKFRGGDCRSGFHDFAIRRGGLVVFPRLAAAEHVHLTKPVDFDAVETMRNIRQNLFFSFFFEFL